MDNQKKANSTRGELLALFGSYISIIRNIFLITSVSIVSFNYSSSFKKLSHRKAVHFLSFALIILSIAYGYFSTIGLHTLVDGLEMNKEDILLYDQIKNQIYFAYLGLFILSLLSLVSLHRLYNWYG